MTRVIFRVAAGPRLGFGHLRRAISIAKALNARPVVSVRGDAAAHTVARRLGCDVVAGAAARALERERPTVLVIDDPNTAAAHVWLRAARSRGVKVASVHDLGIAWIDSDLLIDGSFRRNQDNTKITKATKIRNVSRLSKATLRDFRGLRVVSERRRLLGPRYMPLDPDLPTTPRRRPGHAAPCVLIALGGGPRRGHARAIARAIHRERPDVEIRIAGGFTDKTPTDPQIQWLPSLPTLRHELAHATIAIVAGGVTLYEACALARPSVAVAVSTVSAQRHTVRAARSLGVTLDGGALGDGRAPLRIATLVRRLLNGRKIREMLANRGPRVVDGHGARRVARALARLARNEQQSVA